MAGGTRSELALSSPEGSAFTTSYSNGQRGSYSGPSMERSGSFRESLDNRVLTSASGVARSPAAAPSTSAEALPLSHSLNLEPLSLGDQKYTRYGELRRVLGVSLEEHSFGSLQTKPLHPVAPEDLKRFKVTVLDTSSRARDRAKVLQESIVKLDRLRSRKRQRNENPSNEKSAGALKMGSQIHPNPSDLAAQRLEERTKNPVPNKRIRSSMAEVRVEGRGSVMLRQGTVVDKDKSVAVDREKNMLRACNGGLNPVEDKIRGLPAGGDGWDKNMKRKRSAGTVVTRVMDGERDLKQTMQQRLATEPRPRPSDGLGFRPGSSNGNNGVNKPDGSSQQNVGGTRTLPKSDLDNVTVPNDRRERSAFDKERNITKGTNKPCIREESLVGSQSPLTKGKASRAPRTGSTSAMNSSSNFPRATGSVDAWEQTPSLNKVQSSGLTNNRKRPLPAGSSSPPVTQWVGQRPQKISRTRRTNLISPVSSHDESQVLAEGFSTPDIGARLISADTSGPALSKNMSSGTQQLKMKLENVPSPAVLSESEESAAVENKYKEKGVDNGEDGALNAVQKVATVVLPTKKNKTPKEEIGDGVRRLGRTGRASTHHKSSFPLIKEKLENVDLAKPMRIGRPGSDRSESKVGRPPSKKASDRKAFTRPGHVVNSGTSELTADSDDDHDELLAAANYVRSSCLGSMDQASNPFPFWKKMDPFFAIISSDSIACLKQQITFAEGLDGSLCIDADHKGKYFHQALASEERKSNQTNAVGPGRASGTLYSVDEMHQTAESGKFDSDGWLERVVPLSQRLLAAIIPEYETETFDGDNDWKDSFSQLASNNSYDISGHADFEAKIGNEVDLELQLEMALQAQKNWSRDSFSCNGYAASSNLTGTVINKNSYSNGLLQDNNMLPHSEYIQSSLDRRQDMGTEFSDLSQFDCQYELMSLDDKILLELHSIGLHPEMVPDLADGEEEEIDRDISELKVKLYQKVRGMNDELFKLDKVIQSTRVLEERNLEQLAMNKLVEMAYRKLVGGRGSHGSSSKSGVNKVSKQVALSGVNKVSKQVALAFAKRTLIRCRKFEATGRSCFSEPPFQNIIFSASLPSSDPKAICSIHSGVAAYEDNSCQPRSLASGPCSDLIEGQGPISRKFDRSPLDQFQGITNLPDQPFGKHEMGWSKSKRREVLLDDVVGSAPSRPTSTLGNTLPGGAKGKRSDRDRDQNKGSSVAKAGRPSSGHSRGERKTKTKLKQKTAQLSTSGICLLGRTTEMNNVVPLVQEPCQAGNSGRNKGNGKAGPLHYGNIAQDLPKEVEDTIDFSNLPIDSIEDLGVSDELGGQGQDIASWLNVDEDILQDNDLMGLEIPMDDLTELNMNF